MNPQLDPQVVALAKAIRKAESNGNFQARSKDGSFGAYQFIKPTWDKTAAKFGVKAQWDKATPAQQNEVAYKQLKEWKDKGFNVGQIASMWNAGEGRPNAYKENVSGVNKDGVAYNVANYAKKVATFYQEFKSDGTPQSVPQPQQPAEEESQAGVGQTFGGNLLRGILRPFVRGVNTIAQPITALVTGQKLSDVPTENDYLGDVSGFGMKDDQTAGQRIKDIVGGAAEIGSNFILPGGASTIAKNVGMGAIRETVKTGVKTGVKVGTLAGGGQALQQDKNFGEIATDTVKGALFGGATGGALGTISGVAGAVKNAYNPSKAAIKRSVDDLEAKYSELFTGLSPTKLKKYKNTQDAVEKKNLAGTVGKTPERTLAEAGVVPKQNGARLDTLEQAEDFRTTIAPLREANRAALKEVEMATPKIDLFKEEQAVIARIRNSKGTTSANKDAMVARARREFAATRKEFGSEVPLTIYDDIKASQWGATKFDMAVPQLDRDVHYNIAKVAQQTIEDTARVAGFEDVAQLNREIGDRLEAAKWLENLNGKTVKGGRLGRYIFAGIGASAGGNTFLGKILGAFGGDMLANYLISNSVSTPVKRAILKRIQIEDPITYQRALQWLEEQKILKITRLKLPPPSFIPVGPRTGESSVKMIPAETN